MEPIVPGFIEENFEEWVAFKEENREVWGVGIPEKREIWNPRGCPWLALPE